MCESFQKRDESILDAHIIRRAASGTSAMGYPAEVQAEIGQMLLKHMAGKKVG
jgi:hypothetical protein